MLPVIGMQCSIRCIEQDVATFLANAATLEKGDHCLVLKYGTVEGKLQHQLYVLLG